MSGTSRVIISPALASAGTSTLIRFPLYSPCWRCCGYGHGRLLLLLLLEHHVRLLLLLLYHYLLALLRSHLCHLSHILLMLYHYLLALLRSHLSHLLLLLLHHHLHLLLLLGVRQALPVAHGSCLDHADDCGLVGGSRSRWCARSHACARFFFATTSFHAVPEQEK